MKTTLQIIAVLVLLPGSGCIGETEWPETAVSFLVTDQDGKAVAGAEVRAGGGGRTPGGPKNKASGWTDTNGIVSCRLQSDGRISYFVSKLGYYDTDCWEFKLQSSDNRDRDEAFRTGKWKPWNPTIPVTLRRVIDPIPMYARLVDSSPPLTNSAVGYDLMIGDWVAPHGRGRSTDISFRARFEKKSEDVYDYEVVVSFSNPGDGIQEFSAPPVGQGSDLRSPHWAPEAGYQPSLVRKIVSRKPGRHTQSDVDPNRNYFLRVRTVLDETGTPKSAHYGKIYGDFMQFRYYLNPEPNSRNIEFDPKRNLLKGLKSFEQVRDP
jgi:hypothetical protein